MTEVSSTSDERTVNNTLRHQYRVLTDREKRDIEKAKDLGLDFLNLLSAIGTTAMNERMASRELSLAQTKMEEAVMWAVKHITR